MSVKNKDSVRQYVADVADIRVALASLAVWTAALPAPDGAGELSSLHYGHIASVSLIARQLQEAAKAPGWQWPQRGAQ